MRDLSSYYDVTRKMTQAVFISWLSHRFNLETPISHVVTDAIYFDVWSETDLYTDDDMSVFVTNDCQFDDKGQLFLIVV